ncbi:unnamed protein product [Coregonus sp. 'balchen']|nr:unnamed protein product [Coregonus sp. 'balchen']
MDEEDSQDELINQNASHGKEKRPAGAVGGASADLAGLSSDEDTEKCPICLNSFHSQPVATPESCEHYFCLDCILEWSKNANSCPVDRIVFNNIYLRKCYGGKVQKMITVQKPVKEGQEEVIDLELEQTSCEVCGGSDREDRLLLCDGCDAGYHMECLTPPLDAVPVEEWFCPECQANNRHSRGSVEVQSDTESLSSTRPTTSRSHLPTAGPTRAIARTQQSERVRASVNRHRITQARIAQISPSFLMPQSTWLDETINAVVAGLNTAVYIRNLTSRVPSSRRRRTVKRRKGKSKRSSSATGGKGKAAGTGVKRRKRRVRRTKSRRKLVVKKEPTSRGRIARSLGIGKPKRGSSLPSVYRPTETTLGSMRADIGAASLSVYGDPYDLDPFTSRDDEEEQALATTSLLEAKRRGLSRSALLSHQPVARPITAGLSRRGPSLPQLEEVAEVAPVPDLLGSILSGQSMLLMDSSYVVINRDGSLKDNKPLGLSSSMPGSSRSSNSGESVAQLQSGMSPNTAASSLSLPINGDLVAGPCLSPLTPSSPRPATYPPPILSHPHLHFPAPCRPSPCPGHSHSEATGVRPPHGTQRAATNTPTPDSHSRGRETVPPQPQAKKASPKPGRTEGQRPDRAGPSSAFSSSFSSSSTSSDSPSNPARTSSSTSSTVCFRINASGNAWHARQLSNASAIVASAIVAAGNCLEPASAEEEEAKRKRAERRNKQNPLTSSHTPRDEGSGEGLEVKSELENSDTAKPGHSPHNAPRSGMSGTSTPLSQSQVHLKRERNEPGDEKGQHSQTGNSREPQNQKTTPSSSSSASIHHSNRMVKTEIKSELQDSLPRSPPRSESHSRPSGQGRKTSKGRGSSTEQRSASISPEAGRRRGDKAPDQAGRRRRYEVGRRGDKGGERSSRRSVSRERRRTRSPSDSSTSDFSERSRRKKRRSRSPSKDRRRSRSGSGSSSRERSKRKKQKRGSRERNEGRGSEREKGRPSKDKKRDCSQSRSRSRSRSRERRKDHSRSQPSSSGSKDRIQVRSKDRKRPKSRSRSRERRKEEGSSQGTQSSPGSSSTTSSKKLEEQKGKKKEKVLPRVPLKEEREAKEERKEREIKQEMLSSGLKPLSVLSVSEVKNESDSNDIRTERHASLSAKLLKESKLLKEIKKDKPAFDMLEESLDSKPIKKDKPLSTFSTVKDLQEHKEMEKEQPSALIMEACAVSTSDIADQKDQALKETIKTEPIWPELPQQLTSNIPVPPTQTGQSSPSFSTLSTNPVPAPPQGWGPLQVAPSLFPPVPKALTRTPPPVQPVPVNSEKHEVEEPSDYDDDDMDVDMMLDSLDYVKTEPGGESGEAGVKQEKEGEGGEEEGKTEGEPVPVTAGAKAKPSVKRVTWNLQEPEGPQPEKTGSKLALYKLKLKQEGARRPTSNQEAPLGATSLTDPKVQSTKRGSVSITLPSAPSSSSSLTTVGLSKPGQGEPNEDLGEDDASRNDKYIKKLHMQERAIEEVKLAIKPFYQKRDITKDEYKDIVRKAVQKVCHSKSGEINPVKVANLVKAYVDKYKHARKYRKVEDGGKTQEAETDGTNDPETP